VRRFVPLAILLVVAAGCSTSKPGEKTVLPVPTKITGTVVKVHVVTIAPQYQNGDAAAGKAVFTSAATPSPPRTLTEPSGRTSIS
jgi:hypothetical protein